jgi:hypothetical protein
MEKWNRAPKRRRGEEGTGTTVHDEQPDRQRVFRLGTVEPVPARGIAECW